MEVFIMKKILGWIVSGVMFVYGVFMTLAYIGTQAQLKDELEEKRKIVERHERIISKVEREGIYDLDDYLARQHELSVRLDTDSENFEDMCEEYRIRGVLYNTLMKVKYPWLRENKEI